MEGEELRTVMLNSSGHAWPLDMEITGWGKCRLTLLVVGGGGDGSSSSSYGCAGGGSGYLQYHSLAVPAGTLLTAQVGDQGQASSLAIAIIKIFKFKSFQ